MSALPQAALVDPDRHRVVKVRHETRRRVLTVERVARITPHMLRIDFASPDLADFDSAAHDDHIKLFLPDGRGGTAMRDYTPRAFDRAACSLGIEFALHGTGPATVWALGAKVGDRLEIGGPRGSTVVPDDFDWVVMVGDETALPAIGRRLEASRPGVQITTIVAVDDDADIQSFATAADWRPHWIVRDRDGEDDAATLGAALGRPPPPVGDGFVWIAAEAQVARRLKADTLDRGQPAEWLKAAGYWVRGEPGAADKLV